MMIGKKITNNQHIHLNKSEEEIVRTCLNCRNQDTKLCDLRHHNQKKHKKRNGNNLQKKFCKFWSYKPMGLWESVL